MSNTDPNITHKSKSCSVNVAVQEIRERIMKRGDLPYVSVETQIQMLNDLIQFPLGRFFVENRGANGFWTDYIIDFPKRKIEKRLNNLEDFILNRCPLTLATRERFAIFQASMQRKLKENIVLASIPCGCMRDLLTLDFSHLTSFSLIGIDIDPESLLHAKELSKQLEIDNHVELSLKDAWNLDLTGEIDLITSNGLNVYEPNHNRVRELYNVLFKAIKPGGTLIIGVLTYPPGKNHPTEWCLENLNSDDMLKETILFQDILDCNWRNFRTPKEIYNDFHSVGFSNIEIVYDSYRIFPTVLATK